MRPPFILLVSIVWIFTGCTSENKTTHDKNFSSDIANVFADDFISQIHTHKDLRDGKWLTKNLETKNTKHLAAIFNALASCKDSASFSPVLKRLSQDDIDGNLFNIGMNAIGNLAPQDSTPVLIELAYANPHNNKTEAIYRTIGKAGSLDGFEFLLHQKITSGVMEGLYRSMLHGNSNSESIEKAIKGIDNSDEITQQWAANILNRQKSEDLTPFFETLEKAFLSTKNESLKITLAGTFKKVVGDRKSEFILQELEQTKKPLILVNLLHSMNNMDLSTHIKSILPFISHPNASVAMTALDILDNSHPNGALDEIIKAENQVNNPVVHAKLLGLLTKYHSSKKDLAYRIDQLFLKTDNPMVKSTCIRSMGNDMSNIAWLQNILRSNDDEVLQGVVHETLLSMPLDSIQKHEIITLGLTSDNVALICQSADVITKDKPSASHNQWTSLIDKKIKRLILPRQLEALIELKKCKSRITGEVANAYVPHYNHPIDWKVTSQLPDRAKIKVETTKGIITWELYVDKIPAATTTIIQLIDSGYYDNKLFHRVVPNFVAQGGCPRGDGWGSLDFSLRSEYDASMQYTTGAIGLASAGENTESCQFFMSLVPTPHLDNRYTIIGYVTEGLDVLNKIAVGDRIIKMNRVH